ncbi:hypothetical protein BvCmsOUP088_01032 [Escherichia coli]|nr:hypothetical protein BvCmsOUP088_01032 [Escherichia coli]
MFQTIMGRTLFFIHPYFSLHGMLSKKKDGRQLWRLYQHNLELKSQRKEP